MRKPLATPEELRLLLRYEPDTGKLFWLPRPREMFKTERDANAWNARCVDAEAFTVNCHGYRQGAIHGRKYFAHRVAYAIHHGEWPPDDIDHVNGDRSDNRIANLRAVTRTVNARNAKMRSDNESGYNGVDWHKQRKKWRAQICINGKRKHLGLFDDIEDAVAARKTAEAGLCFTERHGVAP